MSFSISPMFVLRLEGWSFVGWYPDNEHCWVTPDDRLVCWDEAMEYAASAWRARGYGWRVQVPVERRAVP